MKLLNLSCDQIIKLGTATSSHNIRQKGANTKKKHIKKVVVNSSSVVPKKCFQSNKMLKKKNWGRNFSFQCGFPSCLSFIYVCMRCTCSSLCFHSHLADSVNLCGNSGAAIKLPAPVCSGLTSKTVVHSHPCRHERFCLFGQESSVYCEIWSSLSRSIVMLNKNVKVAFCWLECFFFWYFTFKVDLLQGMHLNTVECSEGHCFMEVPDCNCCKAG